MARRVKKAQTKTQQRRERVGSAWIVKKGQRKFISLVLNDYLDENGEPLRLLLVPNRYRRSDRSPELVAYA